MLNDHEKTAGATPLEDTSGLKDRTIKTREQLNRIEFNNIAEAVTRYLAARPTSRMAPFTLAWLSKLHWEMFHKVWTWAGQIRNEELNLGYCHRVFQIEPALKDMLDDLFYWQSSGMDLIEQSALLHHKAVQIHPFLNGNGRWARLLANIWLKRNRHPIINWPETGIIKGSSAIRSEYLKTIKQADLGNTTALKEMHQRYIGNH